MTPRKPVRISTPTPQELQALFNLPNGTAPQEDLQLGSPGLIDDEYDLLETDRDCIIGMAIEAFERAKGGDTRSASRLHKMVDYMGVMFMYLAPREARDKWIDAVWERLCRDGEEGR
jgi:hypothetical protein